MQKSKVIFITTWCPPHGERFPSVHGFLDYAGWIEKERERLEGGHIRTEVKTNSRKDIALVRISEG